MAKIPHPPAGWKWNPPAPQVKPDESFNIRRSVSSATECTGLMMKIPDNESEAEASSKLYGIHLAKPRHSAKH